MATAEDTSLIDRHLAYESGELSQTLRVAGVDHVSSVAVPSPTGDALGDWWLAYLRGLRPRPLTAASSPRLRVAELFCGPGGLALGFQQAVAELGLQWTSAGASDIDAEAVAIYRQHNQTRHTTTRSASMLVDYRVSGEGETCRFLYPPEIVDDAWGSHVGRPDVLLAGPPCQGHSNLNNRTRRTDRRNELYLTVPAMAVATEVPIVIIENVRAVIHDRKQVVQSTERLLRDAGYEITQGVLHAATMGWPQRRERFFLIARRDTSPLPLSAVQLSLESEPRDLSWVLGDLLNRPPTDFMDAQPEFSEENRRRIDWLFDNDEYDLPLSERPDCHKDGTTYNSVYGRLHLDRPAPTITTGFMTPGRGRYIHPTQRRVLTAREAARIQGFPDTYDFRPDPPAEPSKAKLAKWIGDGVPMPLGYMATLAALGPGWPA